jgi:hypothetical protein
MALQSLLLSCLGSFGTLKTGSALINIHKVITETLLYSYGERQLLLRLSLHSKPNLGIRMLVMELLIADPFVQWRPY